MLSDSWSAIPGDSPCFINLQLFPASFLETGISSPASSKARLPERPVPSAGWSRTCSLEGDFRLSSDASAVSAVCLPSPHPGRDGAVTGISELLDQKKGQVSIHF